MATIDNPIGTLRLISPGKEDVFLALEMNWNHHLEGDIQVLTLMDAHELDGVVQGIPVNRHSLNVEGDTRTIIALVETQELGVQSGRMQIYLEYEEVGKLVKEEVEKAND